MQTQTQIKTLTRQLFKYALVGIISNATGYLAYLLVTSLWLSPKIAMTTLYIVGAAVGYIGNRNLTFGYSDGIVGSAVRYIIAHLIGYLMNLTILIIFVDILGYPHQWVQAIAIFCVAGCLFVSFKLFVFPSSRSTA